MKFKNEICVHPDQTQKHGIVNKSIAFYKKIAFEQKSSNTREGVKEKERNKVAGRRV